MRKAFLEVQSGALQGQKIPLYTAGTTVGRSENCDLVLGDYSRVSRHHARIDWVGQSLVIQDQNSTNGVTLNGKRVTQAEVKNGALLELGDFVARVVIQSNEIPKPGKGRQLFDKWRDWPASPAQKLGVLLCVAIVLMLGALGMERQNRADPFERTPDVGPSNANSPADGNSPATGNAAEAQASGNAANGAASQIPDADVVAPQQTPAVVSVDPVGGRISPSAIQNAKAATVLIAHPEAGGYAMGSGFALGDAKRIITNRHVVVDDSGNPQDCLLIFEAGTPAERKVSVAASAISLAPNLGDKDAFQDDLALISLDNGRTLSLPAGRSEDLTETDEVYAVGFPLGTGTLSLGGDLPSASVKPARVERLQRDKNGAVTVIQLGSSVTHGNSGGPVINNRGEVIGVISSGVEGTGMAYAIPMVFVNVLN